MQLPGSYSLTLSLEHNRLIFFLHIPYIKYPFSSLVLGFIVSIFVFCYLGVFQYSPLKYCDALDGIKNWRIFFGYSRQSTICIQIIFLGRQLMRSMEKILFLRDYQFPIEYFYDE